MTPYAEVIGDPIAHSKSPLIHGFWLAKLGLDAEYRRCHVRADQLAGYFADRRTDPAWRGCNITIPHKLAAMPLLDLIDPAAGSVGAVNCACLQGSRLVGANTDVDGVQAALPADLLPAGSEPCLIGTGGAARAALAAFRQRGIGTVRIAARNPSKGFGLLEEFALGGTARSFDDDHDLAAADAIVNATSLGMAGKEPMPAILLDRIAAADRIPVLDMVYDPIETELLRTARSHGSHGVDGLRMLVGQAAAAFELFFGRPAPRAHDAELRALLVA